MTAFVRKFPELLHGANAALIVGAAALALYATWFMRGHHSMVSPHRFAEGIATVLVFVVILLVLIVAPVFVAFRLTLPHPVRGISWVSLLGFVAMIAVKDIAYIVPYSAAAMFSYLFTCDAISTWRGGSRLVGSVCGLLAVASAGALFVMNWAFLYFE